MSDVFKTICRQCHRLSVTDYYGFCDIACLIEYAHIHGYLMDELKIFFDPEGKIKELEEKIAEMDSSDDFYYDEYHTVLNENNNLQEELEEANAEINELKQKIRDLDEELEKYVQEVREYKKTFASFKRDRARFKLIDI